MFLKRRQASAVSFDGNLLVAGGMMYDNAPIDTPDEVMFHHDIEVLHVVRDAPAPRAGPIWLPKRYRGGRTGLTMVAL